MSVADYDFYKNTFKGADIAPYDFDRLVLRANAYLDSIAICVLPDNDMVKMAQCAVAEQWRKNEQGGEVTSQSVGSWSQSFSTSNKSADSRLYDAAALYIGDLISRVRWV